MAGTTMVFGVLLIALSGVSIALSEGVKSPTLFIPSVFGVLLFICGWLARNAGRKKHAMHAAAAIGLLGALMGLGRGLSQLPKILRGETYNGLATTMVWSMALLCLIFVALCVKSFIAARKLREKAG